MQKDSLNNVGSSVSEPKLDQSMLHNILIAITLEIIASKVEYILFIEVKWTNLKS